MKRISFFLLLTLLILSFGLANAEQSINIDFNSITGYYQEGGVDKLVANGNITIPLRITNNSGWPDCKYAVSFAMQLSTPDGATWSNIGLAYDIWDIIVYVPGIVEDTNWLGDMFGDKFIDPIGTDAIGFAGVCGANDLGIREGLDTTGWNLTFTAGATGTICLDHNNIAGWDGYDWGWPSLGLSPTAPLPCLSGNVNPAWGGPYCFELGIPPDMPPVFQTPPVTLSGSHCATLSHTFLATDPDPGEGPGPDVPITYTADIGVINSTTGAWTYTGSLGDVGTPLVLNVTATENDNPTTTTIQVNVTMTNSAPQFTAGCGATIIAQTDAEICFPMTAVDACPGDPKTFSVVSAIVNGGDPAAGAYGFVGNTLCYTPDAADIGNVVFTVGVTDGVDDGQTCTVTFGVSAGAPYAIVIEKTHGTLQGHFVTVDVTLTEQAEALGGFNLLISYDASALTFQGAAEGSLMTECGWEYFTYRFGPDGNCSGGCPSGMLRVVAMAETNNGANHHILDCIPEGDPTLTVLSFLVSNDRTLECTYVPIRFFWIDCGDNTLSNEPGTQLYIAATVKDYDYEYAGYSNLMDEYPDAVLPTFVGPIGCLTEDKVAVMPWIDFFNGGVDIVCADSIDARGDVNLDGLAYTVADAVMFANYFIYGLSAFGTYYEGSIAATDVNADGLTLTVADLVLLIRVVVGDELAIPKLSPVAANLIVGTSTLGVDAEMGAAYVVIEGNVAPQLLADNMEMLVNYDGANTRVLVWSQTNESFTGDFLSVNGDVISAELATAEGAMVMSKLIPADFGLGQNYPNPFNPATTIEVYLPVASNYSLTIYNVTGQVVGEFNGAGEAGTVEVVWDASNNASGVYFYKLTAGNFTATKKMVLMK